MKTLESLAMRWAQWHIAQKASVFSALFMAALGFLNLGLYFIASIDHVGLLGSGIALLCLAGWFFERAGFVLLIEKMRS